MRLIITGAGGFLGHELLQQAWKNELQVVAMSSSPDRLQCFFTGNEFLSVLGKDAIAKGEIRFNPEDVLINCAFPRTDDARLMADGLRYVQETLLQAKAHGAKKIINISSQSVYDPERECAADESSPLCLCSNYAVGKYATELFCNMLGQDTRCCSIRLASLIGPGFNQRVINKMAFAALKNRSIHALDDHQQFGFLDVKDAARAIIKLAEVPGENWRKVYNLGSDQSYTLKQMAETIAGVLKEKWDIDIDVTYGESDKKGSSSLDNTLLQKEIGTYQTVSLQESACRIIADLMNNC